MKPKALTKDKLSLLTQGTITYVDPVILQRGFMYYRAGQIVHVNYREKDIVAKVTGKGLYEVRLDIEQFKRSECSCPYETYCKHMAAVFFAAYSHYEHRPELFLQEHLRARTRLKSIRRKKEHAEHDTERTEQMRQQLNESDSIKTWHAYFESQFRNYFAATRQSFFTFYDEVRERLLPHANSWPTSIKAVYQMNLIFFILRQVELQPMRNGYTYVSRYEHQSMEQLIDRCEQTLTETLGQLDIYEVTQQYPGQMKQMMDWLRKRALTVVKSPVDWVWIYSRVWEHWMIDEKWAQQEQARLTERWSETAESEAIKLRYVCLIMFFDMMFGDDETAMQRWDAHHGRKQAERLFFILNVLVEHEAWERLKQWLIWLLKDVDPKNERSVKTYCSYWSECLEQLSCEREWKAAMQSLLPLSYSSYAPYLLQQGWLEDWVDLQLWLNHSPMDIDPQALIDIKERRPSLLLPLYHQSIERCITEKRRDTYIQAVKLLHQLKGLYERTGQKLRWDEYRKHLTSQYARLRAFQEELRKGSLI